MLETKLFEIRDSMTAIQALAVLVARPNGVLSPSEQWEAEDYLMARAGYGINSPLVILTYLHCHPQLATYDPFDWQERGGRTMFIAHQWIEGHWDELLSGSVIDVRFILGETEAPAISERLGG